MLFAPEPTSRLHPAFPSIAADADLVLVESQTPEELDRELVRSRSILEERLGEAVEIFAYPYGDDGRDPQSLAPVLRNAGYRAACLYGGGPNRLPPPEPFRLTRLAIGPDSNLEALLG